MVASNREHEVDVGASELASHAPSHVAAHVVDVTNEDAVKGFFAALGSFGHLVYTAGDDLPIGP